ncbi:hypothetical protein AB0E83_05600 [Streptomyces sp. NPDC035033]|uniref:hypothetical protein n=1 Tax=Streptomyces sp. NPDC035033 TaxID=3155368 RepID=UPI0033D5554A
MRRLLATPLLLVPLGLALAGCASEPEISPVEAAYNPYMKCLGENKVKIMERSPGVLAVDKAAMDGDPDGVMLAAQKKCENLIPAELPVDPVALEQQKKLAECYRRNGYPDWPDPNPKTGEIEADMDDSAVMRKCGDEIG